MFLALVEYFGSRKAIYTKMNVTRQAFSNYEVQGFFPPARAIEIESFSEGKFLAKDLIKKG